jgi:hypothetical protein
MALSEAMVLEFEKILKEEFDLEIPKSDSVAIANGLTDYFDLLAQLNHQMTLTTPNPQPLKSQN